MPDQSELNPVGPGDFYGFADRLTVAEKAALRRLRTFLRERAEPILAEHWESATPRSFSGTSSQPVIS